MPVLLNQKERNEMKTAKTEKLSYMGRIAGRIYDFNGMPVKLIRPVAEKDGHTWRVKNMDSEDLYDFGMVFNINPAYRNELSKEPIDCPQCKGYKGILGHDCVCDSQERAA
jgi:hypothetical protein